MLVYSEIKKILEENKKELNDFKLITEYFRIKWNKKENFDLYFDEISEDERKEIIKFIENYANNDYPLQYLVGFEYFGNIKINVNSNVLIPRMETEEVVLKFVECIKKKYTKNEEIIIADVCTGSGCIIILIDKLLKDYKLKFHAVDISNQALMVAKKNFETHNIVVETHLGNLLEPLIEKKIIVNTIISNPPYISKTGIVENNVIKYEPEIALFAEDSGFYFCNKIIQEYENVIQGQGLVCLEIGYDQGSKLFLNAKNRYPNNKIDIIKDMNTKDRILLMEIKC